MAGESVDIWDARKESLEKLDPRKELPLKAVHVVMNLNLDGSRWDESWTRVV
jgi:hypothetical protein